MGLKDWLTRKVDGSQSYCNVIGQQAREGDSTLANMDHKIMTLAEADKIVQIWGRYLEYVSGKVTLIFGVRIPESFLPFPRDVLNKALNIMEEHHHRTGNQRAVDLIKETSAELISYVDDEEALLHAAILFNDPKWREAILPAFKAFQKEWIELQR